METYCTGHCRTDLPVRSSWQVPNSRIVKAGIMVGGCKVSSQYVPTNNGLLVTSI